MIAQREQYYSKELAMRLLWLPVTLYLLLQNAWLRWRLRRLGIDPADVPEIKELRRRYLAGEPLDSDDRHPPSSS
jgi:hypothetical protein